MPVDNVEALDRCPWLCDAPDGPNTPFEWPAYFVIDLLRVGITGGAVALITVSVWAIRFLTSLTGILLLSWGYYQHLFREIPACDRNTRQDPSP